MGVKWTQAELDRYKGGKTILDPMPIVKHTSSAMNKTEQAYFAMLDIRRLAGEFERVTRDFPRRFPLSNGHHFSPDFCCWIGNTIVEAHEVKGGFAKKTGKQRDSRVLFDCARVDWPAIKWIWAER